MRCDREVPNRLGRSVESREHLEIEVPDFDLAGVERTGETRTVGCHVDRQVGFGTTEELARPFEARVDYGETRDTEKKDSAVVEPARIEMRGRALGDHSAVRHVDHTHRTRGSAREQVRTIARERKPRHALPGGDLAQDHPIGEARDRDRSIGPGHRGVLPCGIEIEDVDVAVSGRDARDAPTRREFPNQCNPVGESDNDMVPDRIDGQRRRQLAAVVAGEHALEPAALESGIQRRHRLITGRALGREDSHGKRRARVLGHECDAALRQVFAQRDGERRVLLPERNVLLADRPSFRCEQVQGDREARRERHDRADRRRGQRRMPSHPTREAHTHSGGTRADRLVLSNTPQILGQVECRRVAARAILLQSGLEHDRDVLRQRRVERAHVRRCLGLDRDVERRSGRLLERPAQRQRFVQRDAERVDVRASIELIARELELLGRHVRRRAVDLARLRDLRRIGLLLVPRETEVENHGLAVGRDDDVAGLHVAVHDAGFVRGVQRARGTLEKVQDLVELELRGRRETCFDRTRRCLVAHVELHAPRSLLGFTGVGQHLRERASFDEAHGEVRLLALQIRLVDRAQTRMLQPRDDLGLASETAQLVIADRVEARRQHLQRDTTQDARVLGQEDGALTATTELADQSVRADAVRTDDRRGTRSTRTRAGIRATHR